MPFTFSRFKYKSVWAKIGKTKIFSKKQKLVSVEFDRALNFDEYIASLCRKAGKKLYVLETLSNFMCMKKKKLLMEAFIKSQFGYFPLFWMFHSKCVNSKTDHLHE